MGLASATGLVLLFPCSSGHPLRLCPSWPQYEQVLRLFSRALLMRSRSSGSANLLRWVCAICLQATAIQTLSALCQERCLDPGRTGNRELNSEFECAVVKEVQSACAESLHILQSLQGNSTNTMAALAGRFYSDHASRW